jgi:hypothetical protein
MTEFFINASKKPQWNLWAWLGFGTCHARYEDEAPDFAPGYLTTETKVCLDWWDRLRVLVSGKVMVSVATRTDKTVDRSLSISKFSVLPPGHYVRGS